MVRLGLMIEGQNGLTWERWERVLRAAEELGFDSVFRSDHFTNPNPPDKASLDLWASLTYAASHTERIEFGPLVTPVTFRLPPITAKAGAAVDDLSHGRLVLGIGAGWQEREHHEFGIPFPPTPVRFDMLHDYLQVVTLLLGSNEPVSYDGKYFQLHDAILLPRPRRPGGPPILVGGVGEKRTLPLAARYADEWNGMFVPPQRYRTLNDRLTTLIREAGRDPHLVKRSLMTGTVFARNQQDLERQMGLRNTTAQALSERGLIVGTPDMWIARIREYAEAGAERVMLQWLDLDDINGISTMAREVLPAFHD